MTADSANPLAEILSFPASVIVRQQDVIPSDSSGWGLKLVLSLPSRVALAYVKAQLATAGFVEESATDATALFRVVREDAYIWGTVEAAPDGGSHLFLSRSPEPEDPEKY
jgi:hypothetical protein